jgi:hypothetical protein
MPDPTISAPDEVIVTIDGAGVCRTDLDSIEGQCSDRIPVALPDSFLGTRTPVSSSRLVPRCNAPTLATQSSSLHRSPMAPAELAGVAETGTAREETFRTLRGKEDRPSILQ